MFQPPVFEGQRLGEPNSHWLVSCTTSLVVLTWHGEPVKVNTQLEGLEEIGVGFGTLGDGSVENGRTWEETWHYSCLCGARSADQAKCTLSPPDGTLFHRHREVGTIFRSISLLLQIPVVDRRPVFRMC